MNNLYLNNINFNINLNILLLYIYYYSLKYIININNY